MEHYMEFFLLGWNLLDIDLSSSTADLEQNDYDSEQNANRLVLPKKSAPQ